MHKRKKRMPETRRIGRFEGVVAKEFHDFLRLSGDFDAWWVRLVSRFGLVQEVEYLLLNEGEDVHGLLSLSMAKALARMKHTKRSMEVYHYLDHIARLHNQADAQQQLVEVFSGIHDRLRTPNAPEWLDFLVIRFLRVHPEWVDEATLLNESGQFRFHLTPNAGGAWFAWLADENLIPRPVAKELMEKHVL